MEIPLTLLYYIRWSLILFSSTFILKSSSVSHTPLQCCILPYSTIIFIVTALLNLTKVNLPSYECHAAKHLLHYLLLFSNHLIMQELTSIFTFVSSHSLKLCKILFYHLPTTWTLERSSSTSINQSNIGSIRQWACRLAIPTVPSPCESPCMTPSNSIREASPFPSHKPYKHPLDLFCAMVIFFRNNKLSRINFWATCHMLI